VTYSASSEPTFPASHSKACPGNSSCGSAAYLGSQVGDHVYKVNERCLHLWHVVRALGQLGADALLVFVGLRTTLRGLELEEVDMIPHLSHLALENLGLAHDPPVPLVIFL
jgi:hypothetical protein